MTTAQTRKRRERAQEIAEATERAAWDIGPERAQVNPVGGYHRHEVGRRWLAPNDLAREMLPRMRKALEWAIAGYGVPVQQYWKLAWLRVLGHYDSKGRGVRYGAPLTDYGRGVARCLGLCPHERVEAGKTYAIRNGLSELCWRADTCADCGAGRQVVLCAVSEDPRSWERADRWRETIARVEARHDSHIASP